MFIPIRTDSPLRTTPYMNWALIIANVAIFVVQKARPEVADNFALYAHSPWLPTFVAQACMRPDKRTPDQAYSP